MECYAKLEKCFGKGAIQCILFTIGLLLCFTVIAFIAAANIVAVQDIYKVNLTVFATTEKNGTIEHLTGFGYLQRKQ